MKLSDVSKLVNDAIEVADQRAAMKNYFLVKVIDYLWIPLAGVTIAGLMIISSIF